MNRLKQGVGILAIFGLLFSPGLTLAGQSGSAPGQENQAFQVCEKARSADDGRLTVAQRRVPTLGPQEGPVCRYESKEEVRPAPGQCGFNDIGLPVHGLFRCHVPWSRSCPERCEFVSCVESNR